MWERATSAQNQRAGVLDVTRGGQQRDRSLVGERDETGDGGRCRSTLQLGAVAAGELVEALDAVVVPAPEVGARRSIGEPFVESCVGLGQPPRPQAIDEHPIARTTGVIHASKLHIATRRFVGR